MHSHRGSILRYYTRYAQKDAYVGGMLTRHASPPLAVMSVVNLLVMLLAPVSHDTF